MTTNATNTPAGREIRGRTLFIAPPVIALLAWGGLLLFTRFVPPASVLAIVLVFVLLTLALTGTFAPVIYLIRVIFPGERLAQSAANHALREAFLLSICIIFNLVLHLLHSWSIFTALTSVGIIGVIEILMLGMQ